MREGVLAYNGGVCLTTCCLNACILYSGHPLCEATCGPLQFAHVGFRESLLGHPLCE